MRILSHRACSSLKLHHVVIILVIAAFFIISSLRKKPRSSFENSSKKDRGLFKFDSTTREIRVRNLKGELILQGVLGLQVDLSSFSPEESTKNGLHYTWGDILLSITKAEKNCLLVDWESISEESFTPTDCFSLDDSLWFGGGELNRASWPVSKANITMAPFYPRLLSGAAKKGQYYTSVLEPYWLTTSGVAIYVDKHVPLHVSINEHNNKKFCLKADALGYPAHQGAVHLKYRMCFGSNLKSAHTYMMSQFFDKPTDPISTSFMHYPICSLKSPTQSSLEWHFRSLVTRHFPCGTIDFGLQHNFMFDKKLFPSPQSLVQKIQRKGMNVMVGIHSSFSVDSEIAKSAQSEFLATGNGITTVNLANTKAVTWFLEKVRHFKELHDINLLRFCCGEIEFPVNHYTLSSSQNPGTLVHNYAKVAATVGANSDIKVGFRSQSLPLAVRIADRKSEWGRQMGIRSVISTVLSVGFVGYPFVHIGPIGGNGAENSKPEKELYIRWMQMSIFFPIMEFKVYPWEYDDETVDLSSDMLEIRSSIWGKMLEITKSSVETGVPVVRPMWWVAPDDSITYSLHTQFMLGDTYLVAPVLWEGKTQHNVYLPKGVWRQMFTKGTKYELEIGRWFTFNVELRSVVYFECLVSKE